MRKLDLICKRFGKLTVLEPAESKNGRSQWLCKCDCGNEITLPASYLTTGDTQSCGCVKKEAESVNLREKYDRESLRHAKLREDNKSGVKGVSWDKHNNYWRVFIGVNGKQIRIGSYKELKDAISARKHAEEKYWN